MRKKPDVQGYLLDIVAVLYVTQRASFKKDELIRPSFFVAGLGIMQTIF